MTDRRHLLSIGVGLGTALLLSDTAAAASAPDLTQLRRRVARGRSAFRAARYADLTERLPALRRDALAVRQLLTGAPGRAASGVLAQVHMLASELGVKNGDSQAAWAHARAAVSAAEVSGKATVLAEATRICATPLRRQGRSEDAVQLLRDTLGQLDAESSQAEPAHVGAAGALALTASYCAALAGRETTALSLVDIAKDAAARLARERRPYTGELSAHQIHLYQVGVHHLLGQDAVAVRIARQIDPRALPAGERRARLGTDTARALLALGDYEQAFTELLAVESAAPEEARRPSLRLLTSEILTHRPNLVGLRDFAVRTGATPA
ncbi:transcriptional regulator [Streptomyces sp. NPDC050988]|uniref:transcriptional regulator n=1 Tax=Streptomyces sp. NPDC050988 TaxID=3365637 RepID=UPI0037A716B4